MSARGTPVEEAASRRGSWVRRLILQCNVVTVIRVILVIVVTVLIDIMVTIVVNVFAGKNGM